VRGKAVAAVAVAERPGIAQAPAAVTGHPFDVVQTEGRGMVAMANQHMAAGTVILQEAPLLLLKLVPSAEGVILEVARKVASMPWDSREALMKLCPATSSSRGLEAALGQCSVVEAQLPCGVNLADLQVVARILDCNGFVGPPSASREVQQDSAAQPSVHNDQQEDNLQGAVYNVCSRFNHSCQPNVSKHFDAEERLTLRTLRDVAAGEELMFSYMTPSDLLQSTEHRRKALLKGWGFTCACERCAA